MDYVYKMRKDIVYDEENKKYIVFGIDVTTRAGAVVESIPDIFFDSKKADAFIKRCNEEKISLLHLMNEIEDQLP